MPDATFARPDLTTFTGLDELDLEVTGQLLKSDRAVLACRVLEPDDWCHRCGCQGVPRDTVTRALALLCFSFRTGPDRRPQPCQPRACLRSGR